MRLTMLVLVLLLSLGSAMAREVLPEQELVLNGRSLKLNGVGLRKKLFVKVYSGSFYAGKRLTSGPEVLADPGDKVIRMKFLHSRVERAKIVAAFAEGMANNAPDVAGSAEAATFLGFFTGDFVRGDLVDLQLGADGTVRVTHNGKPLGTVMSKGLARGILAVYFGNKPADEGLKNGMLGLEQ